MRDDPTVPHNTHHTNPQQRHSHPSAPSGLSHPPSAAADLVLLGDLTGRYATGSYSRLASDGRSLVLRTDRQGAAEHGHRITAAIAACHVARLGGTVDHLTRLLLHPDHEGGRHARHIALRSGQSRALDYIRRVWASASEAVSTTRALDSRHDAYEVLAALRDRIETTPWRGERGRTALRVLRAHLNFAETAGGLLHHASERQTAEEAADLPHDIASRPRKCPQATRLAAPVASRSWPRGLHLVLQRAAVSFPDHSVPPDRHLRIGPPLRRPQRPTSTPPFSAG